MRRVTRLPVPIAVALVVFVVAELGARAFASGLSDPLVWNDLETQNKVAQIDELSRHDGAAVVFAGSSSMNAAADPRLATRLLGASAFNASLNGADLRSLAFWLERVVVPRLHPRVVVVGTTSLELNDNGITQRDFYRKLTDSEAARRLTGHAGPLDSLEDWFENHSYLVRYRTELRRPASAVKPRARDADVDRWGVLDAIQSFHRRPYGLSDEFRRRSVQESFHDYAVGGAQLEALDHLAESSGRRGYALLVVKMPVTTDVVALHPRGRADYERYERALALFVASRNVAFVDAASRIGDRRYFVDPIHLNAAGMQRFTELLAPELRRLAGHS